MPACWPHAAQIWVPGELWATMHQDMQQPSKVANAMELREKWVQSTNAARAAWTAWTAWLRNRISFTPTDCHSTSAQSCLMKAYSSQPGCHDSGRRIRSASTWVTNRVSCSTVHVRLYTGRAWCFECQRPPQLRWHPGGYLHVLWPAI